MGAEIETSTSCIPRAGELGGVCSGRGECFQFTNGTTIKGVSAFCLCEPGWSPVGDLATDPSVDCGINVAAQRALWGVAAVPHLCLLIMSCYRLYINRRHRLNPALIHVRAFALCVVYGGLLSAVAILQAANEVPGARSIGIDPLTTSLFVVGTSCFFIMVCSPRRSNIVAFDN
jgi:hypothetical protein